MRSLAKVFSTAGIPFCAAGFTTCRAKHRPASVGVASRKQYSRTDDIVNFIFKDFHETWNTTEKYMIAMNPFTHINYNGDSICANCNADGESILWAASRLLAREEAIKVLIVASDGMPAGGDGIHEAAFLKYAVQRIENAGVYIGGLGIGTEYVKQFYRVSETLPFFPPGKGSAEAAPIYLQNLMIRLVDRLMTEGGKNA
jgi:cobalamin biosynthesis protein CobT